MVEWLGMTNRVVTFYNLQMKLANNFLRSGRSGLVGFWRNGLVSLAAVTVMTVTLFAVGALIVTRAFLVSSLAALEEKVDISIYFEPEATAESVAGLQARLEKLPEVKAVVYYSREDELKDFRDLHQANALILRSLQEVDNPFGARLTVLAHHPEQYAAIARFINEEDESVLTSGGLLIDHISFKADVVDRLVAITDSLERLGLAVTVVLLFMSLVVVFNTVSLAIYISREEIAVMRLVGAENNYIRGPFVVEGLIAGFLAALCAMALLYPSMVWLRSATTDFYGGIDFVTFYFGHFASLLLILLAAGLGVGAVSSFLAVRRHLRV